MASFGLKVMRGAFVVGESLAPKLAGRAAFALFCRTPDPRKLSPREERSLRQTTRFMAEARHHRIATPDAVVVAHVFEPAAGAGEAGTVLLVHGWRSRSEHMRALVEAFREEGYRVVTLDLPGHGVSPGRSLTMRSAVSAVSAADTWFGPFEAVVGHSFGGAVTVNAVTGSVVGIPPVQARRMVLISAPSSIPAIFEDFGRFLALGPRTQTAVAERIAAITGQPLDRFVAADQLRQTAIPTLVIHAPDDGEVAFDDARRFAAAGRHVRLHVAPGLGHRRILADPGVAGEMLRFVARRVPAEILH